MKAAETPPRRTRWGPGQSAELREQTAATLGAGPGRRSGPVGDLGSRWGDAGPREGGRWGLGVFQGPGAGAVADRGALPRPARPGPAPPANRNQPEVT